MKQGWEEKKLGDVCDVIAGQSPEGKYYNNEGIGLPFYQGKKEFKEKFIGSPTTWTKNITKEASKDDILMSVRAPVGPVNFATDRICIGRGLAAIRPGERINKEFLFYFLKSQENNIQGNSGAVFNSINKTQIENILLPLPPLPEQRRIVAILDEAFAAIAKAKANTEMNLQNARELFQSSLNKVFNNQDKGWEEKKLGEICLIRPPKSEANKRFGDSDLVSFIPMEDLGICQKNFTIGRVRPLKDVIGSYTYFAEEDVLLAKITPCFENGKLGIARNLTNGVGFGSSEYFVFRTNENLFNEYLFYFLSREEFRKEGAKKMSGAVGHKRVAKDFIENYPISFPPYLEQQKIVSKLDKLSNETQKLEADYKQKLSDLEELKQSILQKAFEGEL
jgi:type I restriction enzyme S subunit